MKSARFGGKTMSNEDKTTNQTAKQAWVNHMLSEEKRHIVGHTQQMADFIKELAAQADLTDPYITAVFESATRSLQISTEELTALARKDLERIVGLSDEPDDEPITIEGTLVDFTDDTQTPSD